MAFNYKQFIYRVYNSSGTYLATWQSELLEGSNHFTHEINQAGSQLQVTLVRDPTNFGEGVDVNFNNQIKVIVQDAESANGLTLFTGYIADYKPDFQNNYVVVTILGYGAELDQYMIENAIPTTTTFDNTENQSFTSGSLQSFGIGTWCAFSFLPDPTISGVGAIELYGATTASAQVAIYTDDRGLPGTIIGSFSNVGTATGKVFLQRNTGGGTFKLVETTDPLGGFGTNVTLSRFTFSSPTAFETDGLKRYWVVIKAPSAGTTSSDSVQLGFNYPDALRSGFATTTNSGATWSADSFNFSTGASTIAMRIFSSTPESSVTYTNTDPSLILQDLITRYRALGGTLNYSGTIDLTGTIIPTLTFNTNTILEGINACLAVAPTDWYWYVDQATNLIHFHKKNSGYDHQLILGQIIDGLEVEKRTEEIINVIYFTGKNNLYAKFTNAASIATYGRKMYRLTDTRVANYLTAKAIAKSILAISAAPNIRVTARVLDSNGGTIRGYDIESIHVGQTITFRNFGGTANSLWDQGKWDQNFWDGVITDLGTYYLQINRLEYSPDEMTLYCSSVPPDVSKRTELIARQLVLTQTQNNPAAPTTTAT